MLKSCNYCGRIHDSKIICNQKKAEEKDRWGNRKGSEAVKFRRTSEWTKLSKRVRERDKNMCLCCKAGMPKATRRFNTEGLSVHHIIPIEEDYSERMNEANLITVCGIHHEMCEAGTIPREKQRELADDSMREAGEDRNAPLIY